MIYYSWNPAPVSLVQWSISQQVCSIFCYLCTSSPSVARAVSAAGFTSWRTAHVGEKSCSASFSFISKVCYKARFHQCVLNWHWLGARFCERTWINFPGWASGSSGDCRRCLLVEGCRTGPPFQLFHWLLMQWWWGTFISRVVTGRAGPKLVILSNHKAVTEHKLLMLIPQQYQHTFIICPCWTLSQKVLWEPHT